MRKLEIHPLISPPTTEIYIGNHLLENDLIKKFCGPLNIAIVVDSHVKDLYGLKLAQSLDGALFTVPNGEKAKSRTAQEGLIDDLFKMGMAKDTILIALGGGATCDLAGFVASIYLRGIPLILIPTTLLAMVDAAIGGKNGIDTPFGKNLMGTIYCPKAVFADLNTLSTLPEKEWLNGLAEILKIGLICDTSIWQLAQKDRGSGELIAKAIEGKIAIIEKDPLEKGLRRILNFGHTIAHGLETSSNFELSHGEAVAIGCVVEAHLSVCLGYLSKRDFEEILPSYTRFSLQLPKQYSRASLHQAMSRDKKNVSGKIRFVLIDRIGHAIAFDGEYCRPVQESELEGTLDWMEKRFKR